MLMEMQMEMGMEMLMEMGMEMQMEMGMEMGKAEFFWYFAHIVVTLHRFCEFYDNETVFGCRTGTNPR